jgi:hypothetical protein
MAVKEGGAERIKSQEFAIRMQKGLTCLRIVLKEINKQAMKVRTCGGDIEDMAS